MSKIGKNDDDKTCWWAHGAAGKLVYCRPSCKMVQALGNLNTSPIDSAITFLKIYPPPQIKESTYMKMTGGCL